MECHIILRKGIPFFGVVNFINLWNDSQIRNELNILRQVFKKCETKFTTSEKMTIVNT